MNLVDFGRRLVLNDVEFPYYLHNFMAETKTLYDLLGQRAPASISVNIIDNGVEYIILDATNDLKDYIKDALSTSIVMAYGKNILVRFRESNDVAVISMVDAERI